MTEFYHEAARDIPVAAETDVLVIGAGPAGFGAALGAARCGARTMLIEPSNCCGGMATSGMMSHWTGSTESPLLHELFRRMEGHPLLPPAGCARGERWSTAHEAMKSVMDEMLREAGVTIQYHTLAVDAIREGDAVTGVVVESKSGREAILSKVAVDGTGDGDVAARAGAEFVLGREGDHGCQPVTLMFRIGGVDCERAVFPPSFETRIELPKGEIQSLGRAHLPHPAGHVLLYRSPLPGEVVVNMTNVTGIDGTDVRDLSKAEGICRSQMAQIVEFLREFVPGYENCYVVAAADYVGVRETRHFKALYSLTETDIVEARLFDDWIATRNFFNFDIHSLKGPGLDENGAQHHFHARGSYTIPYRCCIPAKIDGLLLSGRNIDGTHKAHSNFRVMPICLNVGLGVGVAAALAVRSGVQPRQVPAAAIQAELGKMGVRP